MKTSFDIRSGSRAFLHVLLVIGLCSCSVARTNPARIEIPQEQANYSWWLGIDFFPVHEQIRGIPVSQLDASWHLASELTKEVIPSGILYESGSDIMKEAELSFSRSGDFNNDGVEDLVLVGIYQDKAEKRGTFILILTKDRAGKWQKTFLEQLGRLTFAALSQTDPMEIWFCVGCEFGAYLLWDKEKGQYLLEPFHEEEGA